MNGDSLAEASSRHSMVCEAKIKSIHKKQEIKSFVEKKNTNLLELQCCQRIGGEKKIIGKDPSW